MTKNVNRRLIAIVASSFLVSAAWANPEMAKKEGQKCTVCHDKAGSKLLTSKGMYYELKGSFDGYKELIAEYRKCTACHSREPGNKTLTPKGADAKAKGVTMDHFGTTTPKK